MKNKEQIYDEKISPLMAQVIAICQKHGIAMLANFAIPTDADAGLQCLTSLGDETGEVPATHAKAVALLQPTARQTLMLRTSNGDGSVTMTAIL